MAVSTEFKFWEEENVPVDRAQECIEDQVGDNSPTLWVRERRVYKRQGAPWLQQYDHYRPPSPKSRRKAIVDGRQEMMDMIKDLPESAYELSFKDIVDDQENVEVLQETKVVLPEEKNVKQKDIRLAKKSNNRSGRRICRSESMESEVLQIRMCLPLFQSSRPRSDSRKSFRISSRPVLDGSEKSQKPTVTDWWKMIIASLKQNQKANKTTTCVIGNTRTRYVLLPRNCLSTISSNPQRLKMVKPPKPKLSKLYQTTTVLNVVRDVLPSLFL